jgi:Phage protein Gp138 N-terminal domain
MALAYQQRYEDPLEVLRSALDTKQADIWTSLPGIIQSFDPVKMIATVQPSIQGLHTGPDQKQRWVTLPILPDVPVHFPRGGGYTLTFPIKAGDECLVVFSSRCIDSWWDQGGVQPQRELRMHDLSDGFALVGPFSQKTKLANVSPTTAQLRSDDGKNYIELNNAGKTATVIVGGTSIIADDNANTVTIKGTLHVSGDVVAGFNGNDQVTLQGHHHGLGAAAAGTSAPTAGT